MDPSSPRLGFFRWLLTQGQRWGLLRSALLISGIALLLFSSTFLLAAEWTGAPPPGTAAQLTPEVPSGEQAGTLNVGPALARIDADTLHDGLVRLVIALQPTPTSTPTPAPTPTPKPTPVPQQPTPPQQIQAPNSGPAAPPAAPPAPTPTPQPPSSSCPTAGMSGFALALFNAINSERTQRGLPSLAAHGCVVYVAKLRSDDMASRGYFSHTSPEGETAFSLMNRYGVPYGWAGENLARNNYPDNETVAVAIRDLMASEPHRANILSGNYTHLGVGAAVDGAGMKYYTMVFIGPP